MSGRRTIAARSSSNAVQPIRQSRPNITTRSNTQIHPITSSSRSTIEKDVSELERRMIGSGSESDQSGSKEATADLETYPQSNTAPSSERSDKSESESENPGSRPGFKAKRAKEKLVRIKKLIDDPNINTLVMDSSDACERCSQGGYPCVVRLRGTRIACVGCNKAPCSFNDLVGGKNPIRGKGLLLKITDGLKMIGDGIKDGGKDGTMDKTESLDMAEMIKSIRLQLLEDLPQGMGL
ncbi:hypothetical protein BCR39DRAFT_553247 [Naematelia encephala]|uniref:Uncharacterized protein n=1 Tax=Naematelia encephala TaxID=71784 RepID=A0A1Y2AGN8_9TREE|nr:hypothetical protein BCR39DRAFT_553247 [Naematelia encephala]